MSRNYLLVGACITHDKKWNKPTCIHIFKNILRTHILMPNTYITYETVHENPIGLLGNNAAIANT